MRFAIAIPCYSGHLVQLSQLLDNIEEQTVKPDRVVISCSSTSQPVALKEYSFPITLLTTDKYQGTSTNRNRAGNYLLEHHRDQIDYIAFIDADDIMHRQRLEVLKSAMEQNPDIILHNYHDGKRPEVESNIGKPDLIFNSLIISQTGCVIHANGISDRLWKIMHSQMTVKLKIFEEVKFSDLELHRGKEDCVFCREVFFLRTGIRKIYIPQPLSYYIASNSYW